MVTRAYFARRFLALKLLRGALVAGALYDGALAVLLLARPRPLPRLLGIETSGLFPLDWLAALWLAMLAGLALAAAQDIRRYSAVVAAILAGRALTAILLLAAAGVAQAASLPWLGAGNGALAVILAGAWWPVRR